MRDFSWKYFTLTGDVEAFMLYKEMDQLAAAGGEGEEDAEEGDADNANML
jgi:hypothetical protein